MQKILFTVLVLFTSLFVTNLAYASSSCPTSEDPLVFIQYNDDNATKKDSEKDGNRDLTIMSLLPVTWVIDGNLLLDGVYSISNMKIQILDTSDNIILSDYIQIVKDECKTILLPTLPSGTYQVIVTIGDESFFAEFNL